MLTLVLLRHAKSSWDDPAQDDFDRPLNARGEKAAPEAGRALKSLGITPDLILCSTSRRTRQTLDLLLPGLSLKSKPKTKFDDALYLATASDLLDQIGEIDSAHACVLLIGHNPGLHSLAVSLAGSGETKDLERIADKYPTAAISVLTFERPEWRKARPGSGKLEAFWTPKRV